MNDANKTELVKDENGKTRLVAPGPKSTTSGEMPANTKVRIRAMQAIRVGEQGISPGQEVDVDEELAVEFCDRKFKGNYAFGGERSDFSADRHMIVRAVRV